MKTVSDDDNKSKYIVCQILVVEDSSGDVSPTRRRLGRRVNVD